MMWPRRIVVKSDNQDPPKKSTTAPPILTTRRYPWCFEWFIQAPATEELFQALEVIILEQDSQQLHTVWQRHRNQLQTSLESAYQRHITKSDSYQKFKLITIKLFTGAIADALAELHYRKVLTKAELKTITNCYAAWANQLLANSNTIAREFTDHADWLNDYVYRIALRKSGSRKYRRNYREPRD